MRSLWVAMLLVCLASIAHAGDGRPLLRRGIELYREASYAESVAMLEHARARGGLEAPERVECGFYLGAGYLALGSAGAARRELGAVLQADADYELPQYTSPKVAALFREVKDALDHAPRLKPLPPERRGDALALRFEASRTGGRAFGVTQWRWHGDADWKEAPMSHEGNVLVAAVPVERTGALEYYADGRATSGALQAGSAERPLELSVTVGPKQPPGLAGGVARADRPSRGRKLWWLWTSIGVVAAAGAGVGLYFALRPQPSSTADAVFDFQVH